MIRRLIILLLIVGCTTEPEDCAGVAGGTAEMDNCNVCDSDSSNDNTTCTQDCAGEWGGDAVSRLMGDVDGDGSITGTCCPENCSTDSTCGCDGSIEGIEANPNHDQYFNTSCNGQPSGDVRMFDSILLNHQQYGCGDAEGYSPDNCPIFHWLDIYGDGEINPWDVICLNSYYLYGISAETDSLCSIPDTSNSPCKGKSVGEECCISE